MQKPPGREVFVQLTYRKDYAAAADGQPAQLPPDGHVGAALFPEPYPSAYHPPPFRLKAAEDMSFFTSPPHFGHSFAGSSENFWRSSNWFSQALHWYS
jgi:hypothetical protein